MIENHIIQIKGGKFILNCQNKADLSLKGALQMIRYLYPVAQTLLHMFLLDSLHRIP